MVKNLPANAGDVVSIPGFRKMPWRRKWQPAPVLYGRIPWTEEPGELQSMGLQRVGHDCVHIHIQGNATSVLFPRGHHGSG